MSLISAEGTFALLAGESVTCSFVSLGSIPDEVMWSRDGVELVKIMNRLKIQNFPGSSVVTFETADAIVPGNYTCFVRFGSDERRVTQEIVPAGIEVADAVCHSTYVYASCSYTSRVLIDSGGQCRAAPWRRCTVVLQFH